MDLPYTKNDTDAAYNRVKPNVHQTPLLSSTLINEIVDGEIFFKCENFQKAGSFKIRGATNAILQLPDTARKKGVTTHSSGNFAQALAKAAARLQIPAFIVMPENAPKVKVDAVKAYGAEIRFCKNTQKAREGTMQEWQKEHSATFLHPYDNPNVILGQSTCGYEIFQQLESPDNIISPVGGGGLISGIALAMKSYSPRTKIFAAEPKGADDAWHSFNYGRIFPSDNPNTIADGLLTALGNYTFPVIMQLVSDIITVTDREIVDAMKLIWTRMKIIAEPSSATTLAALIKNKHRFTGQKNVLVLSGGNVDLNNLPF